MSNTVDSRVVEMLFKNSDFEKGVQSTLKSLENLKKGLKLDNVTSGLDQLNEKSSKLNLSALTNGVTGLTTKFSAMGAIALGALASIGAKAVQVGAQLIQSLAVKPLKAGLEEYETNLNSIQTILANTGLEGQKGLDQVNKALTDLNHYSDQTIYNFSEMARNIGTFTAAGIKLEPATAAIKGIANLAAISGSSAEQASTAMYQLSQAMAAGKATLVDWNSVVNAGMGGKVFQEALKETARVQGVAIDDIIKKNGSFRDSLQEGWLTTEVLSATLQKFTGDMSAQQLKQLGYTDKQIAAIIKMGKTAQDAATKVKTVSQLIGTLQEAAGSGWAQTWQLLFGDFEEARTLFTNVNKVLGGFISNSANARNKVIGDWKALGGRTELIKGIAIAFNNVMEVITPIKKAFRDIFPPTTGKQLFELTQAFTKLMGQMRLGEDTMDNIRRTFRGLFAIFDIGIQVLKGIFTVFKTVFSSLSDGSGGILEFTGNVGDWLVALDKAIKKGEGFQNFFKSIGTAIVVPIQLLKSFVGFIKDLVSNMDGLDASSVGNIFEKRFAPLAKLGPGIEKVWDRIFALLKGVAKIMAPLFDIFEQFFTAIGDKIESGFNDVDYNHILDGVNTGLLAGLLLLFKKFLSGGINIDLGKGLFGTIKESFEGLTNVMSAMQAQLKANALIKIAGAIALLTASVVALSLIDSNKLTSSLTALTVMFTQLLGAMAIFEKITATKGFLKMPFLTASMIALAIAIDLLALAVSKLSTLDWPGLAKGLTGVAVLLGSLALFTKFAAVDKAGLSSGAGLILLATGVNILVNAVKNLSGLSWGDMAKGLVGVATLLGALGLFTLLASAEAGGIAQGAGLILLATAIKILASAMEDLGKLSWTAIAKGLAAMAGGLALMGAALILVPPSSILSAAAIFIVAASLGKIGDAVKQMGGLSWKEIAKGLVTMAGALTLISLAIGLLPPTSLLSAAAIFVVASSLGMISKALGTMGGMSWGEIAKSLVVLAGSLTIITLAMIGMTEALPGAAALFVVAASLRVLVPVLQALGEMSWGEIVKSLIALAGAFAVIGIAALVLTPVIPSIAALGVAVGILGVALLAAGVGVLAFATAFQILSVSGVAGAAAIIVIVKKLIGILPIVVTALGDTVIAFAKMIQRTGPAITEAMVTILLSLLSAINRLSPKIVSTLGNLLALLLAAMIKYIPKMADAGMRILTGVLNAIASNIGRMVTAGTNVVVNFINGVSNNLPRVIQAGVNLILNFINGIANAIRNNSYAMGQAGGNLASAIVEGMVRGIAGGISAVVGAAENLAKSALQAAKNKLGIHSPSKEFEDVGKFSALGVGVGLTKYSYIAAKAAEGVGEESIEALRKSISGISDVLTTDANFNPIIRPVLDLTDVKKQSSQIGSVLAPAPIKTDLSYSRAKDASTGYSANKTAQQQTEVMGTTKFEYTQINNSPKALSSAEIYRQTNNQLSTVKGALTKTNAG